MHQATRLPWYRWEENSSPFWLSPLGGTHTHRRQLLVGGIGTSLNVVSWISTCCMIWGGTQVGSRQALLSVTQQNIVSLLCCLPVWIDFHLKSSTMTVVEVIFFFADLYLEFVTERVAHHCNISSWSIYFWGWASQIEQEHSILRNTKVV